ncbi:MAG: putative membrane protein [bacterium]|jgi:uncharacterized membrane protein
MKTVKWIVHILLAVAFLGFGTMKLITPYADMLVEPAMAWAGEFSEMQVKIIGSLEILGALGLLLPVLLKKQKMFVPFAALALGGIMIGAMMTHIGRDEPIIINIVILLLALLTFWWRKDWMKKEAA